MKNRFFTALSICLLISTTALGWGSKGHAIVAEIAAENINKKAQKKVAELLEGRSMAYYSAWMDDIRYTPEYAHTATWHYANVDEGQTYETMTKEQKGDVVVATIDLISQLKKGGLSDSVERLYFKMLIHTVADMHCPMHAGRRTDIGGNRYPIEFFGKATSLHSLWDTAIIESARPWSYTEWSSNLDIETKAQKIARVSGDPLSWFKESVAAAAKIYEGTEENANHSYDYLREFTPLLEDQLYNAGLRLAEVINQIYGGKR